MPYVTRCTTCGHIGLGVTNRPLNSMYLIPCGQPRVTSELRVKERFISASHPHPFHDIVRYERHYNVERCNGAIEYVEYDVEKRRVIE